MSDLHLDRGDFFLVGLLCHLALIRDHPLHASSTDLFPISRSYNTALLLNHLEVHYMVAVRDLLGAPLLAALSRHALGLRRVVTLRS